MGRFPRKRCGHDSTRTVVTCKGDTRDRYGRLIGVCFFADGIDLNGWVVRQGTRTGVPHIFHGVH